MPIHLEEAELSILHHFPSPGTRPFCRPSSWMGHYGIPLFQVERLWRGLSSNVDDCSEAVSLLKQLLSLKGCTILGDKAYGTREIR